MAYSPTVIGIHASPPITPAKYSASPPSASSEPAMFRRE